MNVDSEIASVVALVRDIAAFPSRVVHNLLPLYGGLGLVSLLTFLVPPRYVWMAMLVLAGMFFFLGGMWASTSGARAAFSVFPL
jgi:hypothetical protein